MTSAAARQLSPRRPRTRLFQLRELRTEVERDRRAGVTYPKGVQRPRTRAECEPGGGGEHAHRPCPFATCRYHIAYDQQPTGTLIEYHPGKELHELPATCALDVADEGPQQSTRVGALLNITKSRAGQLEEQAVASMRSNALRLRLLDVPEHFVIKNPPVTIAPSKRPATVPCEDCGDPMPVGARGSLPRFCDLCWPDHVRARARERARTRLEQRRAVAAVGVGQ